MKLVRLRRGLAIVTISVGLSAALAGSAGADPNIHASRTDVQPERQGELIVQCLQDPTIPAENLVLSLNNAPGGQVSLLCGNEAFGARHIHAGHPINNAATFEDCWLTTIATNNTRPGNDPNGSTEWHFPYAPGKEAVVITANAERDTLTAYTTGANSADWDGCAATASPAQ